MAALERKDNAKTAPERRLEIRSFLEGLIHWLGSRRPPDLSEWKGIPLTLSFTQSQKGLRGSCQPRL